MRIGVTALLLVPAVAFAGSAFDGTWKQKLDSVQTTGKPDAFQLVNGEYTCSNCDPPYTVKADGQFHETKGNPYHDAVAVKVLSPTSIEITSKLAGKVTGTNTMEAAGDGKVLKGSYVDHSGAKEATGSYTEKRVSAGPAGSHAISGTWKPDAATAGNEAALTVGYTMTPDSFSMHWNGLSYDAKFDGKEYPVNGDPTHTTVTLKRIDEHTVLETDHRLGKATDEIRLAVAADGKTISGEDKDLAHGQTTTYTLEKSK